MSSWLGCEGNVCFSWSNTCWIVLPAAHHSPRFPVKLRIDRTGVLAVPIAVRRWRKNPHAEPTMVGRNPLNRSRSSRDKQARGAVPQAPARTTVRTVLVLASKANTAKKTDHQYSNAARRIQTGMIAIATEDLVHIQNITNHYILYHNPPKYQVPSHNQGWQFCWQFCWQHQHHKHSTKKVSVSCCVRAVVSALRCAALRALLLRCFSFPLYCAYVLTRFSFSRFPFHVFFHVFLFIFTVQFK